MTCEDAASTVPSSRPVADSTTETGAPPVPRRSTSGRPVCVQYQPVGRRRSAPDAVSPSTAAWAAAPPNSAMSAAVIGPSEAAQQSWGPST
jgi:hypothetical protein